MRMYHIVLDASICGWALRLLPRLSAVNSVAANIGVCVSFQISVFSGHVPGSGTAESCGLNLQLCVLL